MFQVTSGFTTTIYMIVSTSMCNRGSTPHKNINIRFPPPLYICVHFCTIMYMNITEFRKDISKHFNEAVQGRPVYIQRAGQMFKLEAFKANEEKRIYAISPAKEPTARTASSPRVTPDEVIEIFSAPPKNLFTADKLAIRPCSHGSNPKFCKHAKNGKPCK